MRVFLSWSGDYSRQVAAAVKGWLPYLINEVEPFMSSSIEAGTRWQAEISTQLEATDFGIIFVTADNQAKPWLNFEAGALAKSVSASHVVPLAINLGLADIENPLGQFQGQILDEAGMKSIVRALNAVAQKPLDDGMIDKLLSKWWPELHEEVEAIKSGPLAQTALIQAERPEREILEELLATVRGLDRSQRSISHDVDQLSRQARVDIRSDPGFTRHARLLGQREFNEFVNLRMKNRVDLDDYVTSVGPGGYSIWFRSPPNRMARRAIDLIEREIGAEIIVDVNPKFFNQIQEINEEDTPDEMQ
ncbi:hypothetical protein ACIA5G_00035 [Amycolatopsis sp. NPDC051758]|uniref:hypothetical protein n=1 Tax=Amycolatopsis sp. NPDC051758 TaxID=3363935 RepID=UPI003787F9C4